MPCSVAVLRPSSIAVLLLALCVQGGCQKGTRDNHAAAASATEARPSGTRNPPASPAPSAARTEPAASAPKPPAARGARADGGAGAPAARQIRYRVAAVGDSLTDAKVGGGKYLALLRKRCPRSLFDNYGVGGEMVNQMRKRFASDVLSKRNADRTPRYTHVIIFGGVNDLYSDQTAGRSNERIQKDLTRMYSMAQAQGIRTIAITVAPWGGFSRYFNPRRGANTIALNRWIKAQQGASVDHVVDAYPLLSCGDSTRICPEYAEPFSDGLHFGPRGHERLGELLYREVFSDCA